MLNVANALFLQAFNVFLH